MSVEAMNWAYQQKVGNPNAKAVLIALSNQADQDGRCWPSVDYLMQRTELSRRSVVKYLAYLEGERFMEKELRPGDGSGRKTNIYVLRVGQPRQPVLDGVAPPLNGQSAPRAQRRQSAPDAQRAMCTSGRQCARGAPKQSLNNQSSVPDGTEPAAPNLWDVGKGQGIPGSVIGKWIKQHGEQKVADCIAQLAIKRPADPVQWGVGYLRDLPQHRMPRDPGKVEEWARLNGLPPPRMGEELTDYRQRISA